MKKILRIIVVIIILSCLLVGCGQDINAQKREVYENIFNDVQSIKSSSKNSVISILSNGEKFLDGEISSSGNSKKIVYIDDKLYYTIYNIGINSYMEIHIPEHKNSDGETIKSEDLYYKTNGDSEFETNYLLKKIDVQDFIKLSQISKESITSIEYIETKNIHGVDCDLIEVNNQIERYEEKFDNKSVFYFNESKDVFGFEVLTEKTSMICYFPDKVDIKLPEGIEFITVDNNTIKEKISILESIKEQKPTNGQQPTNEQQPTNNVD